ncbi:MAG TPA: PspC domain-containing protein [Cyclobacteriaceae bacterium]|jgi:phage shock protein PspC (stress-responsive transcriptional regulator)|nr:PspC domain-containing protein [Cyclobacteriaceae bacterium]
MSNSPLSRTKGKVVGGVCGGLAKSMGYDPLWVRLLFAVLLFFTGGLIIIVYAILWAVMPEET